jgi:hypothetical protein
MITRPHLEDPETAVRYLADKLSNAEREAFEEYYLAHPKVVEEMELDAKFKAGLICIRDANELDRLATVSKRPWGMAPLAIAASLLVAVITTLVFRYVVPEVVLASSIAALRHPLGSQPAVAATYTLVPTRAGLYHAEIPLPNSPQAIRLQVVLDIEPPIPPLEVTLTAVADNASRTDLVVLRQLRADENGIITLYLNSAAVRPGTYELSVSREPKSTGIAESTFDLKVTPSEGVSPPRSP